MSFMSVVSDTQRVAFMGNYFVKVERSLFERKFYLVLRELWIYDLIFHCFVNFGNFHRFLLEIVAM